MPSFKFDPLSKVVNAAIIDTYSDIGVTQHRYSHWAARGLRKIAGERLRLPIRKAVLPVNKECFTATLPVDFDEEIFVGYINKNTRIPIFINRNLVNLDEIDRLGRCNKCGNEILNEELNSTQETDVIFTFNSVDYSETITKKIEPSGDYWLIKKTPYLDTTASPNVVSYRETKQLITNIDMEECGCVSRSSENENALKLASNDTFCCNFTDRSELCDHNMGGYKVFEESGLIQLDRKFKPDSLYIEYTSCLPKINGEYQVPKVAFETLVAYTKFKAIENKPNSLISDRNWHLQMYVNESKNMKKILGRVKLSRIINIASRLPIFDISNRI